MKNNQRLILFAVFALSALNATAQLKSTGPLFLTHVNMLDVVNKSLRKDMVVGISGNKITMVAPANETNIPNAARVIDCSGKFLIPGLWDMHVHLGNATVYSFPLFIANGITGVRDMGTKNFDSIRQWRAAIAAEQLIGPRIISPGPIADGGHPQDNIHVGVNNEQEARHLVDSLAGIGVDFIKVHEHLTKETYYAIADEAAKKHIPFAGHVPVTDTGYLIAGAAASNAGQRSLEHMMGLPFSSDTNNALKQLFATLRKNNTWVTPTLSVYHAQAEAAAAALKADSLIDYISPVLIAWWKQNAADWPERNKNAMKWLLSARVKMIPFLRDANIGLLAGTDVGFPYVLPGFGLHEELKYLVDAGLSPMEALRTATINPAIYLGRENELGSIEKGKLADLVLLNGNPVDDIRNIRLVNAVIVNGKLLDRSSISVLLSDVAKKMKAK